MSLFFLHFTIVFSITQPLILIHCLVRDAIQYLYTVNTQCWNSISSCSSSQAATRSVPLFVRAGTDSVTVRSYHFIFFLYLFQTDIWNDITLCFLGVQVQCGASWPYKTGERDRTRRESTSTSYITCISSSAPPSISCFVSFPISHPIPNSSQSDFQQEKYREAVGWRCKSAYFKLLVGFLFLTSERKHV